MPFLVAWPVMVATMYFVVPFASRFSSVPPTHVYSLEEVTSPDAWRYLFMHLWFLYHLMILYVAAGALSVLARRIPADTRARLLDHFENVVHRGGIGVLALLAGVTLYPMHSWAIDSDAGPLPPLRLLGLFGLFFAFGWLIFHRREVLEGFKRPAWSFLAAGIACSVGMVVGRIVAGQVLSGATDSYRIQAVICAGLMTMGLFLLSKLDATAGVVPSLVCIVTAGLGIGGIVVTLSIGVQNHVPFAIVGVATSALQFYRSVGGVVGLAVLGVVLTTRFSSSLEEVVPEAVKAGLAAGRFEELQSDPRALVDSATADRLRSDLVMSGADGVARAQELLDSLGVALWEALDMVFVAASIAAALSLGFAFFFRVPVRSEPASGDTIDTDGEQQP